MAKRRKNFLDHTLQTLGKRRKRFFYTSILRSFSSNIFRTVGVSDFATTEKCTIYRFTRKENQSPLMQQHFSVLISSPRQSYDKAPTLKWLDETVLPTVVLTVISSNSNRLVIAMIQLRYFHLVTLPLQLNHLQL